MAKKKMTKEEMKRAAEAEYDKAIAPARDEYDKVIAAANAEYEKVHAPARAKLNKVRNAVWAKFQKRLAEINAMPDDEVDPEVQKAIDFLKSKGYKFPLDK